EVMTCSRSGRPRRGTRGLGTPPDTEAIRLPLPAARIRHSLTVVIVFFIASAFPSRTLRNCRERVPRMGLKHESHKADRHENRYRERRCHQLMQKRDPADA